MRWLGVRWWCGCGGVGRRRTRRWRVACRAEGGSSSAWGSKRPAWQVGPSCVPVPGLTLAPPPRAAAAQHAHQGCGGAQAGAGGRGGAAGAAAGGSQAHGAGDCGCGAGRRGRWQGSSRAANVGREAGDLLSGSPPLPVSATPAAGKRARVQTLYRTDRLEALGEALAVLQFARAQVARGAVGRGWRRGGVLGQQSGRSPGEEECMLRVRATLLSPRPAPARRRPSRRAT